MVVRVQAFLVGLLLVVGGGRVLTYVEPPTPTATEVWAALLGARSVRVELRYFRPQGGLLEYATGVLDVAAQRSSTRVDSAQGQYDQVVDRTAVYVRPEPGRWYRYLLGSQPTHVFELAGLLRTAGQLTRTGDGHVRGVAVQRFQVSEVLYVHVDGGGLPRRIELRWPNGTPRGQLDLYDFGAAPAVTPPPRFVPADDLDDALRQAAGR